MTRPRMFTIDGRTMTLVEWAKVAGLSTSRMMARARAGIPLLTVKYGDTTYYPEREWFKRNLKALNEARDPEAYLRGVEAVRGEEAAEKLRRLRDKA